MQSELREQTRKLARALNVIGLMNVQFAIQAGVIYVLEVNPRASRTVPFVSKATGLPLAKIAARVMTGHKLKQLVGAIERVPPYFSVKSVVFPFMKFLEADPILGPEMKSTGEVMGTGRTFGEAYAKAQTGSGVVLPRQSHDHAWHFGNDRRLTDERGDQSAAPLGDTRCDQPELAIEPAEECRCSAGIHSYCPVTPGSPGRRFRRRR